MSKNRKKKKTGGGRTRRRNKTLEGGVNVGVENGDLSLL